MEKRCGYIAIIGRPNAGKSTLFNRLLGQKLSSVSYKPQTTRHRIIGVRTDDDAQYVFVDTPGIHLSGKKLLNKVLNKNALNVLYDVHLILWVVDRGQWTAEEDHILKSLQEIECPVILVVNKIDKLGDRKGLLPILATLAERYSFAEIVPISALRKDNLDELLNASKVYLPVSEFFYSPEYITDRDVSFLVGEIIREAVFIYLEKELPYASHVEIENISTQSDQMQISAAIWVEKESQKAILIGHKGEMLKRIGTHARQAIQRKLNTNVHLDLWAKVNKDWQNSSQVVGKYES